MQDETREIDDLLTYWLGPPTADGSVPRDRARDAVARGDEQALTLLERVFLYLPFEHAEDPAAQDESVRHFTSLVAEAPAVARPAFEEFLRYAVDHRDCVARFGRFPQRNATLGRISTPAERTFLDELAG